MASEVVDIDDVMENIVDSYEEQGTKTTTLSENQRYGILAPVTQRLLEAMVKCGTKKVNQFKTELEALVERVKSGETLLPPQPETVGDLKDKDETDTGAVEEVQISQSHSKHEPFRSIIV